MDTRNQQWHTPPSRITLGADEVHIWRASLDVSVDLLSRLHSSLSDDEWARVDRFHFEKDRVQFTAAHGILRDIVGRYLDVAPAELRFGVGPHGKPALQGTAAGERVEFNMSHSRWMALFAVASHRAVGVDIEYIRGDVAYEKIAGRFFHDTEEAYLRRLTEQERRGAFFVHWTYKEAYIKGRGRGLSIPTRSFIVRVMDDGRATVDHAGAPEADGGTPAGPAPAWRTEADVRAVDTTAGPVPPGHAGRETGQPKHWCLFALDPAPGYAGAVAIEGDAARLVLWDW
ncbi:MAG TPA: 4'-phosphopantetheinyl transferase superfamily protein [Patescibacteria group bacterium]|nr:4'-phosphopantetheinyl transferase superfamily protein [Patescibacteria group bacterium]